MRESDYQAIEDQFKKLLDELGSILSPSEIAEIREFLDVGEYGLALETLCFIFEEEGKRVPAAAFERLRGLGLSMQMDESTWNNLKST